MIRLPLPSTRTQELLTHGMQLALLLLVGYGLVAGEPKAISNGGIALLITILPAVLERNYRFPLDPWLGLWITTAVFLHTLGSAGLYGQVGWWDHLTHATSASLVAATGYTAARAIELHNDDIHVPQRLFFVYILIVVLSFGVIWELFEFGLDLAADATGVSMPVAQEGLDDTVRDAMFNSLGAIVVAALGQVHLTDVADSLRERFLAPDR